MSQSKVPTYLGLAAVGAGAFYLYRAGGDPKTATQDMKSELPVASIPRCTLEYEYVLRG